MNFVSRVWIVILAETILLSIQNKAVSMMYPSQSDEAWTRFTNLFF